MRGSNPVIRNLIYYQLYWKDEIKKKNPAIAWFKKINLQVKHSEGKLAGPRHLHTQICISFCSIQCLEFSRKISLQKNVHFNIGSWRKKDWYPSNARTQNKGFCFLGFLLLFLLSHGTLSLSPLWTSREVGWAPCYKTPLLKAYGYVVDIKQRNKLTRFFNLVIFFNENLAICNHKKSTRLDSKLAKY